MINMTEYTQVLCCPTAIAFRNTNNSKQLLQKNMAVVYGL